MVDRTAQAEWKGGLKDGQGSVKLGSGAYNGPYSFESRFENESGTNAEELIPAAHAGCYSMAFSHILEGAGFKPETIRTSAKVTLEKKGEGFAITKIHLDNESQIAGIDANKFQELAEKAKTGCPVSKVLTGAEITLSTKLLQTK